MTEMVKALRDQRTGKLIWTTEDSAAFNKLYPTARSFLEDTVSPILQTKSSDYGIVGYLYMVTNGKVRVIRFFSKALLGPKLNGLPGKKSTLVLRLSKTYRFILKTDHMNLTYLTASTI